MLAVVVGFLSCCCCCRVFATWWKNKQRFCCLSRNRCFRLDALDDGPNIVIFFGAAFPFSTTLNSLQSFSCWIIHFYMDLHERFRCAMEIYGFIFVKWMNASVCARIWSLIVSFSKLNFLFRHPVPYRKNNETVAIDRRDATRVYCIPNVCTVQRISDVQSMATNPM